MTNAPWAARDEAAREIERRVGLRAERDALLAAHTTMRVGGPADLLVTVRDRFTLRGVVRLAQSKGWPLQILGRGSNVVVSDAGIRGIVLLNRSADVTIDAASATLSADSGLSMAKLSTLAAETGLTGAEFTLAIPGNLGGAIWANAGAHGGEMSQILQRVVIMRPDGSEEELGPDALNLSTALCEAVIDHAREIVDIVEKHPIDVIHRRLHISRHRNIDDEERAILSPPLHRLHLGGRDDGQIGRAHV